MRGMLRTVTTSEPACPAQLHGLDGGHSQPGAPSTPFCLVNETSMGILMTDQSPASFLRPDASLVLLGASGLGQGGEVRVNGWRECFVAPSLAASLLGRWGSIILTLELGKQFPRPSLLQGDEAVDLRFHENSACIKRPRANACLPSEGSFPR